MWKEKAVEPENKPAQVAEKPGPTGKPTLAPGLQALIGFLHWPVTVG